MTQNNLQISATKPAITLSVSPRFEIFHALRLVLAPPYGADEQWRRAARSKLPQSFYTRVDRFCPNPIIWPNIADAVQCEALDGTFFQVLKAYAEIAPERFQYVVAEGIFHDAAIARDLIAGKTTIRQVVEEAPESQQAWNSFIGLYPFSEDAPVAQFFERLFENPEVIRDETVRLLSEFWDCVFEDTWESILPSLQRSLATLERIIPTCSLSEIADRALLNVRVNEVEKTIRAARGAFVLPFEQIDRIHFLPSALNVNRLWTGFDHEDSDLITAVFPYFDPSIQMMEPDGKSRPASVQNVEPALVFKVLGNATRFAMVKIIAAEPMNSSELARRMSLTKGTVSHHVRMLRLASLVEEEWADGSVTLSLNSSTIENLSGRTMDILLDR